MNIMNFFIYFLCLHLIFTHHLLSKVLKAHLVLGVLILLFV